MSYYGIVFNSFGDALLGLLVFTKQSKAIMAQRCLLNISNEYDDQKFEVWDSKVQAILNSVEIGSIPEIEENEIDNYGYATVKENDSKLRVKVLNMDSIPII